MCSSIASRRFATIALAVALLAWCGGARAMTDPLETFKRGMFRFNDAGSTTS